MRTTCLGGPTKLIVWLLPTARRPTKGSLFRENPCQLFCDCFRRRRAATSRLVPQPSLPTTSKRRTQPLGYGLQSVRVRAPILFERLPEGRSRPIPAICPVPYAHVRPHWWSPRDLRESFEHPKRPS